MKVKVFKIRVAEAFQISDEAIINDYLVQYNIVNMNAKLIQGEGDYWSVLVYYQEKQGKSSSTKSASISEEELSEEEKIIYNKLKDWRSEKAREYQFPPYIIFHNVHLMSIAKQKPNNLEDLEQIVGVGKSKTEKYGIEIIEVLENA